MATAAAREHDAPRHAPPLELDAEGFLADPNRWEPPVAAELARQSGVGELGPDHWRVIEYLRERRLRRGAIPTIRQICKASDLQRAQVKRLFGGCLNLWRIAGLPDPGEEVRAYLA